jgi:hypothetical protein
MFDSSTFSVGESSSNSLDEGAGQHLIRFAKRFSQPLFDFFHFTLVPPMSNKNYFLARERILPYD